MVMGGGRGYVAHRCGKRAITKDPDGLCRTHRLAREGAQDSEVDERNLLRSREHERRLGELAQHLADFYQLPVALEYDEAQPTRPPTGRLMIEPHDLLRVLRAQDLMPRRAS
ncbi:hypothetical protein [Frankia sp. AgKG'84/4]|uniref:hypothetical protein n=1 Tax=Frankia sp. AgKG'84/4 TaxID=573490 RepID=UPI00202A86C9|nr:hypothetical protein [Frankia sp. AgKG'84/4]MCL9795906.1 hypothetical protein [Frankia sp. AgKG'84/4]